MTLLLVITAALSMAGSAPAVASGQRVKEQDNAWRATKNGHIMPLRVIEARILPRMGAADYLGPELNGDVYRLKFMHEGQVIWIDVNGRTGRVVGRSH